MRPMARAEPTAEVPSAISQRDTSQMRADADHDQEGFVPGDRSVIISRRCISRKIGVSSVGVRKCRHSFRACLRNFRICSKPDEYRFPTPIDGQLCPGRKVGDIDGDRCERTDISGGVHLVHERPDGGASSHDSRSCCGVVKKIPACCVLVRGTHVTCSTRQLRRRVNGARVMFCKRDPLSWTRRRAISSD